MNTAELSMLCLILGIVGVLFTWAGAANALRRDDVRIRAAGGLLVVAGVLFTVGALASYSLIL